jgi:uncharacterized membrane protein YidH (DUF202 family)
MKKKFALGAFIIAIGLIIASVAILRNNNFDNAQSRSESQSSSEAEHLPDGMPWELVSRHFISLY